MSSANRPTHAHFIHGRYEEARAMKKNKFEKQATRAVSRQTIVPNTVAEHGDLVLATSHPAATFRMKLSSRPKIEAV
jgi:hypothetical protein